MWRGARVADRGGLENRCTFAGTEGSNPSLSESKGLDMIKNIVFDVGNVLVRYDPDFIVSCAFPAHEDPKALVQGIFKHQTWYELNLGQISEQQAIKEYHSRLGLEIEQLENLAQIVKESLIPIPGSIELLKQLHSTYPLYALTDNTHEIMAYLKQRYDFWPLFNGVVVSASIGHLKPSKEIFHHLLSTYQLVAHETLFLDDIARNVEGARNVGIKAILFENTEQTVNEMKQMGILV